MSTSPDTTQLLVEGRRGQKGAIDALMPRLHTELKQIAHRLLQKRPAGGVLDTTGLVHEAYLKLIDQTQVTWEDQAHFQALSARAMRQILVDHFRHQQAEKRGGWGPRRGVQGTDPLPHDGHPLYRTTVIFWVFVVPPACRRRK